MTWGCNWFSLRRGFYCFAGLFSLPVFIGFAYFSASLSPRLVFTWVAFQTHLGVPMLPHKLVITIKTFVICFKEKTTHKNLRGAGAWKTA